MERLGKLEALREEIGMPLMPRSRGGWERAIEISRTAWARNHFQRFEKKGAWLRSTGSTAKSRNAQPGWLLQVRNVAIAASSSEPYPVDWTALTSVAFPAASDEMEICPTN